MGRSGALQVPFAEDMLVEGRAISSSSSPEHFPVEGSYYLAVSFIIGALVSGSLGHGSHEVTNKSSMMT
jgi:hypothetical protein